MNSKNLFRLLIFLILSLINIWAGHTENESLAFFSKPLLMPALALWFYSETKNSLPPFRNLILLALFFSWGGDTLLMFVESKGEQFFLLGLLSFLTAHVLYAVAFLKNVNLRKGFLNKNWWAAVPFIILYGGINYFLIPNVPKAMQAPVLIYGAVIMFMAISALNRNTFVVKGSFQYVFVGALTFMVSDMILAFNKFDSPIPNASVLIMSTYLLGQFWIAKGWSKLTVSKN